MAYSVWEILGHRDSSHMQRYSRTVGQFQRTPHTGRDMQERDGNFQYIRPSETLPPFLCRAIQANIRN